MNAPAPEQVGRVLERTVMLAYLDSVLASVLADKVDSWEARMLVRVMIMLVRVMIDDLEQGVIDEPFRPYREGRAARIRSKRGAR